MQRPGQVGATPGRSTSVFPTLMASEATTKNQPPDMDIMAFHTRPGRAKGSSSLRKRWKGRKR